MAAQLDAAAGEKPLPGTTTAKEQEALSEDLDANLGPGRETRVEARL